jgi:predicted dinucleotide-binding enzyme
MKKSVGIIGAGHIGTTIAEIARRGGRRVVLSNSRGPETLTSLVQQLGEGVSAGTVAEAAAADSDDADAKSAVTGLFEDGGFFVIDLGGLRDGGQMQQFRGPLAGHNLIRLP